MSSSLRRAYVDGRFGQLHYAEQGDGPTVVLVHMAGFNHLQFIKAMPLLAERGYRAIAIDLPGFGASDTPSSPPSVRDYAGAVLDLLDALGVESAAVVGSHLGAQVATEVAVTKHGSVDRVVLVGPLPTNAEERAGGQAQVEAERSARTEPDGRHLTTMWDFTLEFFAGWTDIEAVQRLVTSQLAAGDHNWFGHNAVFSYDHASSLGRLQQPTLILTNTGDVAHMLSARAHQDFPAFGYHELDGGTALIVDEQPEEWTKALAAFLGEPA
jgi:pimeloyl-ACP methyl ester carboxylesterase